MFKRCKKWLKKWRNHIMHVFGHKNVKNGDRNLKFSMVVVSKKVSNIYSVFVFLSFMQIFPKIYILANFWVKNSKFWKYEIAIRKDIKFPSFCLSLFAIYFKTHGSTAVGSLVVFWSEMAWYDVTKTSKNFPAYLAQIVSENVELMS